MLASPFASLKARGGVLMTKNSYIHCITAASVARKSLMKCVLLCPRSKRKLMEMQIEFLESSDITVEKETKLT